MPDLIFLDWELVDRYYAGELDEAQAALVRRWLMLHSNEHRILNNLERALDGDVNENASLGRVTANDAYLSWAGVTAAMRWGRQANQANTPASDATPNVYRGITVREQTAAIGRRFHALVERWCVRATRVMRLSSQQD